MKRSTYREHALAACLVLFSISSKAQTCEVFRENFNGSTTFVEKLLPYGPPGTCAFATAATFSNNGTEQNMTVFSYFEACLRKTGLNLPVGEYLIKVKYRIGNNTTFRANTCDVTNFDDRWGATCDVPNRVIAVNNQMIFERPGNHANENRIVLLSYSGRIDSIDLAMVGNCSTAGFEIFFDYLVIINKTALPQVNFSYAASGRTVTFTDSTTNGGTEAPQWDFGDGNTSTDANPVHTYDADSTYTVCLIRSNSCGPDTACMDVTVSGDSTSGISRIPEDLFVYYDRSAESLYIKMHEPSSQGTIIRLYNMSGKLEREGVIEPSGTRTQLSTSGLSPGIYMIRTTGKQLFTGKVVLY